MKDIELANEGVIKEIVMLFLAMAEEYNTEGFNKWREDEDSEVLQIMTGHNMDLIESFTNHCKENGIEIPKDVFEDYFGA